MSAPANEARLVVIGGGPGGYACAFAAADLGLEVVLVDPAPQPGGVCLYRGCIPSKALLHAAKLIVDANEAADLGLRFGAPEVDLDRLRAWKEGIVAKLTGGLGDLVKRKKIRHLRGKARLTGGRTLAIDLVDGGTETLAFRDAVLATGSAPARLPFAPEGVGRVMDSTGALALADVPTSLLVVGGGYIGLELGSAYAALGSRVTVVEMTGGLLPGVDRDLTSVLRRRLDGAFDRILLNTAVTSLTPDDDGVAVALKGKSEEEGRFSRVLVAVGRRPVTAGLGLDAAGVAVDAKGFVTVDERRRTSADGIWAIGDVAGEPMLAHKASREGKTVAEAIAGRRTVYDPQAIPAVVFTDPEIAWCGLTQEQARAAGRKVAVAKLPWSASGRAATLGRAVGLTKLISDPETGRLLGVGLAGPGAGELIAEGCLALEMGATVEDLRWTVHPHPTLSETLMETADLVPRD